MVGTIETLAKAFGMICQKFEDVGLHSLHSLMKIIDFFI
jgi:hypothetical protein